MFTTKARRHEEKPKGQWSKKCVELPRNAESVRHVSAERAIAGVVAMVQICRTWFFFFVSSW
jgi:hypothetical protein